MDIGLQNGQTHCDGNIAGVIHYAHSQWVACPCHRDGAVGQVTGGEEWSRVVVDVVLLVEQTIEVGWDPEVGKGEVSRL